MNVRCEFLVEVCLHEFECIFPCAHLSFIQQKTAHTFLHLAFSFFHFWETSSRISVLLEFDLEAPNGGSTGLWQINSLCLYFQRPYNKTKDIKTPWRREDPSNGYCRQVLHKTNAFMLDARNISLVTAGIFSFLLFHLTFGGVTDPCEPPPHATKASGNLVAVSLCTACSTLLMSSPTTTPTTSSSTTVTSTWSPASVTAAPTHSEETTGTGAL